MSFSVQEIEQLNLLLLSDQETNKQIALELIKNAPHNIPSFAIALCIVAYLSDESRTEIEGLAHDLLVQNISSQEVTTLQDQIIVLNYAQYKFKVPEGWNTFQNPLRKFLSIHEAALENYWPFFQLNPTPYSKIYTLLANRIKTEWNNYQKALFFYEKAMLLDSDNTQAHFGFAMIMHNFYIKRGHCLDQVNRVLSCYICAYKGPPNISSYRNAAILCSDIGDIKRSAFYYEEGLKHCPNDTILLNNYANLLMNKLGDYTRARFYAHKGLEIAPYDPSLLDTMAYIELDGFQNYEQAKFLFNKVIQQGEKHHYSFTGLGDLYLQLRDYNKAEQYYLKGLHNGLQYTSREINEIVTKLKKIVSLYSKYLNDPVRAEHYQQKLVRLKRKQ